MKERKGFTLIELLIVVAIIAILAAIAIPNFLAAQTRSKVSRARAEMQTLATALESYYIDNNVYPAPDRSGLVGMAAGDDGNQDGSIPRALTTPIAFISSLSRDPFKANNRGLYEYGGGFPSSPGNIAPVADRFNRWPSAGWIVSSQGPDNVDGSSGITGGTKLLEETAWNDAEFRGFFAGVRLEGHGLTYDPTNGTTSPGDLWRRGP